MDIDCPECGRRVTLDANNIIPYHDNAPPLRSVCRASKEDATPVVTIIERARKEEREACARELEAIASRLDTTALGAPESANLSPKLLSLAAKSGAAAIRAVANEIRVNSTGGTR